MQIASVAGALERVDDRVGLDFGKLGEAERERLLHFSANRESPVVRVEFAWFVHVIAHEEVRNRSEPAVEVLDRGFEIDEAEGSQNHSVFARNRDGLFLRESPGQEGGRCACGKCCPGNLLEEVASGIHSGAANKRTAFKILL